VKDFDENIDLTAVCFDERCFQVIDATDHKTRIRVMDQIKEQISTKEKEGR